MSVVRSRIGTVLALLAACAAAGGCAPTQGEEPAGRSVGAQAASPSAAPKTPAPAGQETPQPAVAKRPDLTNLVAGWQVEAPGEEAGAVLLLGRDMTLWPSCGLAAMGVWRAADTVLVLDAGSFNGSCRRSRDRLPDWWTLVWGHRPDGSGHALLDRDGTVVARLRTGVTRPTHHPNVVKDMTRIPVLDAELRSWLRRQVVPLPEGLTPVTPDRLVGRWVSPEKDARGSGEEPYIELDPDGSWHGSDGCNDGMGRWAASPESTVVVTQALHTLVACPGPGPDATPDDVPGQVQSAASVGLDGSELVLLDRAGKESTRLRRDDPT